MKKQIAVSILFLFITAITFGQQANLLSPSPVASTDEDAVTTGVIIIDTDELIFINPNPAQNYIQFTISPENKKLTIVNSMGTIVKDLVMTSQIVDVSSLPNGLYYFTVVDLTNGSQRHGSFNILR